MDIVVVIFLCSLFFGLGVGGALLFDPWRHATEQKLIDERAAASHFASELHEAQKRLVEANASLLRAENESKELAEESRVLRRVLYSRSEYGPMLEEKAKFAYEIFRHPEIQNMDPAVIWDANQAILRYLRFGVKDPTSKDEKA